MSEAQNSRRHFLKKFGLGSLASLAATRKASALPSQISEELLNSLSKHPYAILQSATSETATTLVIIAPQNALVTFEVRELGSEYRPPISIKDMSLYPNQDRVFHVNVNDLQKDRDYQLICYENSTLKDFRIFRGLHETHRRFAALSCSNQSVANPQKEIWSSVLNENLDVLFYLGDSVYANSPWDTTLWRITPPEKAYERYIQAFKIIPLYRAEKLIPVFNTWDDHDYASNNGDRNHPHKNKMQEIFRIFFPLEYGPHLEKGPGVSFAISFANCRYYFIDNRSFRDYSAQTNTLFGDEQKVWLSQELHRYPQASVLIMGGQIYGLGWNRDSMDNHHPEDLAWLKSLTKNHTHPITFITGDIHFSQVQKLSAQEFGYLNYEFTSSAMHSYSAPGWGRRSPLSGQIHYCGWANYNIFQITPEEQKLQVQIICKDANDGVQYQNSLSIEKT